MNAIGRIALFCYAALVFPIGHSIAAPAGEPIKIGGSLSLTGPLAGAGIIQKITGEIYVDGLNAKNGLLGRPVQWVLKDDQSRPDVTRTLYEQVITHDKVDLLMGPYGTGAILSAMGVAQRYGKLLVHNSFGTPSLAKYENQFPAGGTPANPEVAWPRLLFAAVATSPKPPKTVAIVTSKFPSVHFVSVGAREIAKQSGVREVAFIEYEFGTRDFGPIASRVKDAKADFVFFGAIGIDGPLLVDAMKKIDYVPPMHAYLFPAAGPMARSPDANLALALTAFEAHPPFTTDPVAAGFVREFNLRAAKAGLPDPNVDLFASIAFSGWQVLEAAVTATRSLDDKVLSAWMKTGRAKTILGELRWDGPNNHSIGKDLYKVKQLQNGKWLVVWPPEYAAPGAKMIVR